MIVEELVVEILIMAKAGVVQLAAVLSVRGSARLHHRHLDLEDPVREQLPLVPLHEADLLRPNVANQRHQIVDYGIFQ